MKTTVKQSLAAAVVSLLAACGGSNSSGSALTKQFNYGANQAPSSSEQSAGATAQTSFSTTATLSTTPSADNGLAIVAMSDTLASAALGASAFGDLPSHPEMARAVQQAATTCGTVAGNTITYNNCTLGDSGFSFTINGTVTVTAGNVTWSVTGNFAGTSSGSNFNINVNEDGNITVTGTTISGHATTDTSGTISGNGQSVSFGLGTAAILNLTYQTSPSYCITSGTLELRRVWSSRPNGVSPQDAPDAGIKLTWTACNAFQVAHSQ
jgi:hypothetical protein